MCVDHILNKNSIGHLLRTSRDYVLPPPTPPPKVLEKDHIYVHFQRVFAVFVVLLTKILPTKYSFLALQLNIGERAVFPRPPPPFHTKE